MDVCTDTFLNLWVKFSVGYILPVLEYSLTENEIINPFKISFKIILFYHLPSLQPEV